MDKVHILCNCYVDHLPEVKEILESIGEVTYREYSYKELLKNIEYYEVLLPSLNVKLDEGLLQKAKKLKLIATPSTGTDHIDLKSADRLGINVMSLKNDYEFLKNVTATAELAFALLLSVVRRLPFAFESVKIGHWNSKDFRGYELLDKTIGIIGYGRLGEMVSRYAQAFRMHVIAYDPYKKIEDRWSRQVDFDTLLKESDIITIHVHLSPETERLISEREFTLMKDGVWLVNASRGAIIDEDAFLKALKSGKVAGAGIDVICGELEGNFEEKPLIKYAREHNNLVITPHMGGMTFESQAKAYVFTARKIQRFFDNIAGDRK